MIDGMSTQPSGGPVTARFDELFDGLTTAHVADGCLRAEVPVRCAAAARGRPRRRLAGRVPRRGTRQRRRVPRGVQDAAPGDVLVVDNGGRLDEACVGDLMVLEALAAGLGAW